MSVSNDRELAQIREQRRIELQKQLEAQANQQLDAEIEAQKKADAKALQQELNSTAVAKFKANLEARFYTALAKQITDNVFGSDGLQQDSGTYTAVNGEIITWSTVTSGDNAGVTVTVQEPNGTTTTYTLPYQDNQ